MKTIKLYIIFFLSVINISAFSVGEHNHINTLLSWEDFIIRDENGRTINLLGEHARTAGSISDYKDILKLLIPEDASDEFLKHIIGDGNRSLENLRNIFNN